jgi:hypothetical protein
VEDECGEARTCSVVGLVKKFLSSIYIVGMAKTVNYHLSSALMPRVLVGQQAPKSLQRRQTLVCERTSLDDNLDIKNNVMQRPHHQALYFTTRPGLLVK